MHNQPDARLVMKVRLEASPCVRIAALYGAITQKNTFLSDSTDALTRKLELTVDVHTLQTLTDDSFHQLIKAEECFPSPPPKKRSISAL